MYIISNHSTDRNSLVHPITSEKPRNASLHSKKNARHKKLKSIVVDFSFLKVLTPCRAAWYINPIYELNIFVWDYNTLDSCCISQPSTAADLNSLLFKGIIVKFNKFIIFWGKQTENGWRLGGNTHDFYIIYV